MNTNSEFFQVTRGNTQSHQRDNGSNHLRATPRSAADALPRATGAVSSERHANSKEVDLGPGDSASFPTWTFWGVTNVIMTNNGPTELFATLQAGAGGVLTFVLAPAGQNGSVVSTSGAWAGATLWIKNASEDPSSILHVEVW